MDPAELSQVLGGQTGAGVALVHVLQRMTDFEGSSVSKQALKKSRPDHSRLPKSVTVEENRLSAGRNLGKSLLWNQIPTIDPFIAMLSSVL